MEKAERSDIPNIDKKKYGATSMFLILCFSYFAAILALLPLSTLLQENLDYDNSFWQYLGG